MASLWLWQWLRAVWQMSTCIVIVVMLSSRVSDGSETELDHSASETTSTILHCGTFPHAMELRAALRDIGVQTRQQCESLDLDSRLRTARRGVLLYAGGVREHCITTMHRLNSLPGAIELPDSIPEDDEDAKFASGTGEDTEMEACELQTKLPSDATGREEVSMVDGLSANMDPSQVHQQQQPGNMPFPFPGLAPVYKPPEFGTGPTIKPLETIIQDAHRMLLFLHGASASLRNAAVLTGRLESLQREHDIWMNRSRALGVIEGHHVQLVALRTLLSTLNETRLEHLVCHYAYPGCDAENVPSPWLSRMDRTSACHRYQASRVLLHPLPNTITDNLTETFLAKFMKGQCAQIVEASGVAEKSISDCYSQTKGVCNGRPVYKCPGHLQMTDDPAHWVGPIYMRSLQAYTGLALSSALNTSLMSPCSFPCGLRCRNSDAIDQGQVTVLKRVRVVAFFLLFSGCVVMVAVAISRRQIVLHYPQRHSVYMAIIFLFWSLHYVPAGLMDTESLLCYSDKTARMPGTYTDSSLCTFTFVFFYGAHIVFLAMAVTGAAILFMLARELDPMRSPILAKKLAIAEVGSILLSLALGCVATAVVLHRKNVFPLVSAGYCTVFKDDFRPGVLIPFSINIGLQGLLLIATLFELYRDRRRSRKMQSYAVNRPVVTGVQPVTRVRRAFLAAIFNFIWSAIAFLYIVFSVREGERPVMPAFISPFECTLATCGDSSCPPSSLTSPHFFPIVITFLSIAAIFGLIFPSIVLFSSRGTLAQTPEVTYQHVPIVTSKQLSTVSLATQSFRDPSPPVIGELDEPPRRLSNYPTDI
eukprot:scpid36602/ scgid11754/ 